ncbi:MAG TPA: hypothetical protein VN721_06640 [Flavipsychrobacter sp.]|nr:hypothetical protein [Flavipsychrobacter sp.]
MSLIEDVLEFNKTSLMPVLNTPQMPTIRRCVLRQISIQKQIDDLNTAWSEKNVDNAARAISNCLYTLTSIAFELGLQNHLEIYLHEVHIVNMVKMNTVDTYYPKNKRDPVNIANVTEGMLINMFNQTALG